MVYRGVIARVAAAAVLAGAGLVGGAQAADPNAPAEFVVGTSVAAPAPPRVGINLYSPRLNMWTKDPGFEPIILRYKSYATGGGADYILNETGPTTDVWRTITDGFFDGATVRVYRFAGNQITHVRTDTVTQYFASQANGYRINLASSGPPVEMGDIYFLSATPANAPMGSVHPRMAHLVNLDVWAPLPSAGTSTMRDESTTAPVNGGRSSLKITSTAPGLAALRQRGWLPPVNGEDSPEPGTPMRFSIWMKQEGIATGSATISIEGWGPAPGVTRTFTGVTDQWQLFEYDFIAPAYNASGVGATPQIAFTGPGTLWVDNAELYDRTQATYALDPRFVQGAIDAGAGSVRIWSGHQGEWGRTLEDWTNPDGQAFINWSTNNGRVKDIPFKLQAGLKFCQQVGAEPWLIVHPSMTEQEWIDLIDFLAGPDTTTYGAKRAAQGQAAPWTDVFPKIRLELNNESWNPGFQPWADVSPLIYGAWAERFYSLVRSHPHFQPGKFEFMLNGWAIQTGATGFGQVARGVCPSGDAIGITSYNFGWRLAPPDNSMVFNDSGVANTLLYLPGFEKQIIDGHAATRDTLAQQGTVYNLAYYESGSGYPAPAPGVPFSVVHEKYGKSLAAAVSVLDCHLHASLRGMRDQCFFIFAGGPNWSSHTSVGSGFRPHANWLALTLRNRLATGDMMSGALTGAPTVDIPWHTGFGGSRPRFFDVPLVSCYAFRDATGWSVIALSRKLEGDTPVTLRLPFANAQSVTLHRLTGDPRANNIDAQAISIETEVGPSFTPDFTFTLPAGSVYGWRFEGTDAPVAPTEPTPTIHQAPGQADPSPIGEARFLVRFDLPVTGFTVADVLLSGSAGPQVATVAQSDPFDMTTYIVTVNGLSAPGDATIDIVPGAAAGPGGAPSLAPIIVDNSVTFTPTEQHVVYGFEDFNLDPGAAPTPPFLQNVTTGVGFSAGWRLQDFGPNYTVGFSLANAVPLGFRHLVTTGSYATGGVGATAADRPFDVDDEYANVQLVNANPPQIGRSGATVWMSALLRKDLDSDAEAYLGWSDTTSGFNGSGGKLAVGYFGAASNVNGERRWSLRVRNQANNGYDVYPTGVPVVVGEAALFVLRARFDARDSFDLFVNPQSLGGAAPQTPDVSWQQAQTGPSIHFRTLVFQCGATASASLDEIRFGDSFRAVTPTRPCPADTNGDGVITFHDLNNVLSDFGQSGQPGQFAGDVNGDGAVNFLDLNIVLSNFGVAC